MSPTTNDPMEPFYFDGDAIVPDEAGSSLTDATDLLAEMVQTARTALGRELTVDEWYRLMNQAEAAADVPVTHRSDYPEA